MLKSIKSITLGAIVISTILVGGCATQMPVGNYYTGIKGNWYTGEKVNNDIEITKEGKACSHSVLAVAAFGDNSIATAQKKGGIKNVASVNYTAKNILGVFGTYCTIVKGN
jgi:outer membrane murein-binding lipoprotein Lpp